jgi:hypothetical protein
MEDLGQFLVLNRMQVRSSAAWGLFPLQTPFILLMKICWVGGSQKGSVIQAVSTADLRNKLMCVILGGSYLV